MAEAYPRPAPTGRDALRPVPPPAPVVGHPARRDHVRPTTKAEAEAESDRQAGLILARARAKL